MSSSDSARGADGTRLLAYVLILFGVFWLLAATGFVPSGIVRAVRMLWPLLVIGAGLDLIGVRKVFRSLPYALVGVAIIAIAGLFLPAFERTDELASLHIREPLGDARRAEIAVDPTDSALLVKSDTSEGVLIEGTALGAATFDLTARGGAIRRVDVTARRHSDGRFQLSSRPGRESAEAPSASTEIRLTDRIPLELTVLGRDRTSVLDLSGLALEGLTYEGAAGPGRITLATGGPERYDAQVSGGTGPIDLTIPEGSRLNLRLEPGPGGVAVAVGKQSDLTLVLRAGNGPVAMSLPEAARIRVVVEDPDGGIVSLPDRLQLVRGAVEGEDENVYETPGYRDVIPTIDIRIEETGPSPIAIR